ncbi:endoplasmic reticulum membrane sensor NFE2L1 isoform X1 [Cricetulus griseus]|uniref:Endoplasmic reticulum membrane sensor NFE2L1 n=1 Tax=Cricetulus griseus TaxID=10029 RepID=G3H5T8_CRIGR|nr:endoplasmic reticulum membrane sensor NFE2L1 isoform X1 [Cricetulus griseus]XP_027280002.1 endoplasmic reticulum membrane sensor NFE2L1 isoform X1 [Cricetulus griseus]XP_027280003.1 endoplasmic reticulum membrane sensor NFE2L1 isoform X1 [Cricetulus griseus]XP_027280004.1 endoplasmic reticulum membrane sensor NFE2L1 isoform X1 [Cricetulus griseus]XP_027290466.1 endoplasmic reticulum membrane sensor NFE2L1 isoform X1 [Cricetulus griseus]XP_035304195.1 endoplasmic reticulum membrane sensor NF
MLSLKKYLTEGLLQFTILLSLIGVRVDVDTYLTSQLPPLREIILGPSSAYTQTQFHNLRNTLDGYGIHPKSIDLDNYFTARRLLSQVRALDRFQVPTTEVNAWLVHRDPEGSVSGSQPNSGLALESSSGLQDVTGPDNGVRESETEQGFSEDLEDLGAVAPPAGGDLTKEDIDLIDILWRQDIDLGAGREVFDYSHRQKEQDVDKELQDGGEREDTWAGEGAEALARDLLVDGETGESFPAQFPADVSSITEAVPSESESPTLQNSLLSPLLTGTESPFDLEQQWQDLMSIMEMQAMEVNTSASEILYSAPPGDPLSTNYSLAPNTPINQNVSLHQASLGGCSQDFSLFSPEVESIPVASSSTLLPLVPSNSTSLNSTFGSTNLAGLFFPSQLNGTANDTSGPELPDPLGGLLDEAMLDEISLMDLAIEEGFNPVQASQLEEEFDSDSGLSLDSSHSPSSLSSSEGSSSSSSSSSSSASSSASSSFSEEGAVGYSSDSETLDLEEAEGAVGYQPEYSKFCRMSYQDPSQLSCLPYLEHVGHNHTYNMAPSALDSADLPPPSTLKKGSKEKQADFLDKQMSRDEHRARAMKIPFTNDKIINLPVEEFNELLSKYQLSEAQLSLIRDIRRRGKNKMAAQNCRKRKLDTILNLERDVEDLQRDKARLLREKVEFLRSLRQMKQKVQSLYQEVFGRLRDENGRPYSPSQYALQYAGDGSVLLIPRTMADQQARRQERKPKDRRK